MSLLATALQTMLNLRQILLVVLLRFITLLLIAWTEKETNYCTYIYRKIWDRRIYSTHENNSTSCRNGCLETCTVLVVPSKTNLWVFRFNASTSRRTCLDVPGQFRGNLTETCSRYPPTDPKHALSACGAASRITPITKNECHKNHPNGRFVIGFHSL